MGLVTKEQVLELQKKHGIAEHSHVNGLMYCWECVCLVLHDKPAKQLREESAKHFWEEIHKEENCDHSPIYPNFCDICLKDE